jgi:hypothetical protein
MPCLRSSPALASCLIRAWRPFPGRKRGSENAREIRSWRAAHAGEIDLRLRDSTRYAGELAISSRVNPFGSVFTGLRDRSGPANLVYQILDFERCVWIAKHPQAQAIATRVLRNARLAGRRKWSPAGRAIDESSAEPPLFRRQPN